MICGAGLEYLVRSREVACASCGKIEHGHILCPGGHYLCDPCHNKDALTLIREIAHATASRDPFEIAEGMMNVPGLPMLGCQHAFIAGGAFLAALKNERSLGVTDADIDEVFERTARQAHGGYCGLSGVCGIVPAIGAAFSVLTGARCGTDGAQRIAMEAATRVARSIADLTGPSCCKAYVRGALEAAAGALRESLGVGLPAQERAVCRFPRRHPHGCREERCPYFGDTRVRRAAARGSDDGAPARPARGDAGGGC